MKKVELNKQQKKDALFTTAFKLFTSQGFSKTSISDISTNAGIAKGTFYLYFKDKYDIRNKLIAHKAGEVCKKAHEALQHEHITDYEDRIIFFVNHIIDQLSDDKILMKFISKNLSWGVIKNVAMDETVKKQYDIEATYNAYKEAPGYHFKNPDILFFMIVELVNSTCYHSVVESRPASIEELKPRLYESIRAIIHSQMITEDSGKIDDKKGTD